jgi:hypothetical protein
MKITRIIVKGFQQFQDFDLDLTDPRTGQPLEKVCLIGRNGTGKSTLLRLIDRQLRIPPTAPAKPDLFRDGEMVVCAVKMVADAKYCWVVKDRFGTNRVLTETVEQTDSWARFVAGDAGDSPDLFGAALLGGGYLESQYALSGITLQSVQGDLVVYSPPDTTSLLPRGRRMPNASVDKALKLFAKFPVFNEVGAEQVNAFWNALIYHIKRRDQDWQDYLQRPENRNKSVAQAEAEFQKLHPEILVEIAAVWNRILATAGLEFDYQAAKKPVQLSDNLEAYIKVRESGQRLEYNALSSGIRNFIFRLGHIFSLYFGRAVRNGFLLIDEPENSLFPDFLYDLIDIYLGIVRNTQVFVATHNPIIAAQFRPEERVILEFDDRYHVKPRRGITPEGDDPNDVLTKDFDVRSIYGPEGLKKWERFLELRRLVRQTSDAVRKRALIDEYMQIGNAYNFAADAISPQNA